MQPFKLPPRVWTTLFCAGFVLSAWAGIHVSRFPTGEPVDWMASSFLAAIFVWSPARARIPTAAACVLAELALRLIAGQAPGLAAAMTALTVAEAALATALLTRMSKAPRLVNLVQLLKLLALVILPTTAVSTMLYAVLVAATSQADLIGAALHWFIGHGAGMVAALSLLLLLKTPFRAGMTRLLRAEKAAYALVWLALLTSPFNGLQMLMFFLIGPALGVMAFRLGPRPTAFGVIGMNLVGELSYYLIPALQVTMPGMTKEQASLYGVAYSQATLLGGLCMALAVYYHVRLKRQVELRADAARRARARALAADKAKSEFLANMSHEIRTPLNGVIGVVASLARTQLSKDQREMVGLIESSGVTLERLVSDILDFSKIEAGRLEIEHGTFDLRAELDGVIEVFRLRAQEKGLAFETRHSERARGRFVGDAVRIRQVLGNLLSNAVKFTASGQITVDLCVSDPNDPGQASTLILEVADTGIGFDEAFAAQMFHRFSQADASISRRFGGTGLGLSITRGLAELMGGEIQARSRPGEGASFRLTLPLPRECALEAYDAGLQAAAPSAAPAAPGLAGLRVLLAEDHPINQRVVELILGPFGVELSIVENGQEAVEALQTQRFDLVLMDMQMPVMDGLEATRRIRLMQAGQRPTPIVAMTANAMKQDRAACLEAGMDAFIAKPVDAQQFLSVIEAVLASSDQIPALAKAG